MIVIPSLYSNHIDQWLDTFGSQLLIINGDNLNKKPWEEIQKLQEFLGLEVEITRDDFYFCEIKGFYCHK